MLSCKQTNKTVFCVDLCAAVLLIIRGGGITPISYFSYHTHISSKGALTLVRREATAEDYVVHTEPGPANTTKHHVHVRLRPLWDIMLILSRLAAK